MKRVIELRPGAKKYDNYVLIILTLSFLHDLEVLVLYALLALVNLKSVSGKLNSPSSECSPSEFIYEIVTFRMVQRDNGVDTE